MDDQLDGKTLVGTYVCTDQPGEFRWQPGSLTQVCGIMAAYFLYLSVLLRLHQYFFCFFFSVLAGDYEWVLGGS